MKSCMFFSIPGFIAVYHHDIERDKLGLFERSIKKTQEVPLRPEKPIQIALARWNDDRSKVIFYITSAIYSFNKFIFSDRESFSDFIHIPIVKGKLICFHKISKENLPYHYIINNKDWNYCYFSSDGNNQAIINIVYNENLRLIVRISNPKITRSGSHYDFNFTPDTFVINHINLKEKETEISKSVETEHSNLLSNSYLIDMGFDFNRNYDFNGDESIFNI